MSTMYSEFLAELYSISSTRNTDFKAWTLWLEWRVRQVKNTIARLFENHFKCELFTMKFHLLHHLCNEVEKFCSMRVLNAALY